jgi:predicted ArsR family transcriptional regulator
MSSASDDPALVSVSCLSDPVRRQLYDFVAGHPEPVGRDEAAAAAGIGRAIAVYHLDKLVESGLLAASYRRPAGRGGPGAGRPAKYYVRSAREFTVTVPPREYELAAHLLAQAVTADADQGGGSRAALHDAARRFGEEAGARHLASAAANPDDATGPWDAEAGGPDPDTGAGGADPDTGAGSADPDTELDTAGLVTAALRGHGFEPWTDGDGTVGLRNCPFHRLAEQHREIVCGMNLALIEGLVAGLGAGGMRPVLEPRPGQCCVVILTGRPPAGTATTGAR